MAEEPAQAVTASEEIQAKFGTLVASGWMFAEQGQFDAARASYVLASMINPCGGNIGPNISILRHSIGDTRGECVLSVPPTEDNVTSFFKPVAVLEVMSPLMMLSKTEVPDALADSIAHCIKTFIPAPHHVENIVEDREHVMFLSTGRVGTVSLLHLFADSNLTPYHTYWWQYQPPLAWWMMTALLTNKSCDAAANEWAAMRAAEWLGPKPMMAMNHLDTIFAPIFASLHTRSKFVYLKRNPEDIFKSFHCKNQWLDNQLRVLYANAEDYFTFYRDGRATIPEHIAWYIKFTDTFCKAFGSVVGPDRYIEIEVEKLWSQNEAEIKKLLDFTGSTVTVPDATTHFQTKFNEKTHKDTIPLEPGLTEFKRAWE